MSIDVDMTRRHFAIGAAAIAGGVAVGAHAQAEEPAGLKSEFLFRLVADLEAPQNVGATPDGGRQIFYAKGGTVEGPKIKATVLPGGGDWFRMRSDGVGILDVRATMKTDDGALIYVTYNGMVNGDYFRVVPWFQTASEKYAWLNKLIAVGVRRPAGTGQISYDVYAIL